MAFNPQDYLIKLKGKDYLEVKWRIVWFKDSVKDGSIQTELLEYQDGLAICKAIVIINGSIVATGIANADSRKGNPIWKGKEIMKAETAAIGRALAHAGYGTQFTGEDEHDFIADSPVASNNNGKQPQKPPQESPVWTLERTTAFVGWCKQVMSDYKQSDMLQALNDNLDRPIKNFASMKDYPGSEQHAIDAIIAFEAGYDENNIEDAIKQILPNLSGTDFENKTQSVKLAVSRGIRNHGKVDF